MNCECSTPGICPRSGRRVRWPDIQSCRGAGSGREPPSNSCRDCVHRGDPAMGESGKQIGSEGCGCSNELAGILWWNCETAGGPVAESYARKCANFERKEVIHGSEEQQLQSQP